MYCNETIGKFTGFFGSLTFAINVKSCKKPCEFLNKKNVTRNFVSVENVLDCTCKKKERENSLKISKNCLGLN